MRTGDPGVVHRMMQRPEPVEGPFDHGRDGVRIAHVRLARQDALACGIEALGQAVTSPSLRLAATTAVPSWWSFSAMASPRSVPAPVTRTALPLNSDKAGLAIRT